MALLTMCMPILPGKKSKWQEMMDTLQQEPTKGAFDASREDAGVHERTFLQETPHGDFVILTFEGDDPETSFGKIMEGMPDDFAEFAREVHGLDINASPPPLPKMVYDSRS